LAFGLALSCDNGTTEQKPDGSPKVLVFTDTAANIQVAISASQEAARARVTDDGKPQTGDYYFIKDLATGDILSQGTIEFVDPVITFKSSDGKEFQTMLNNGTLGRIEIPTSSGGTISINPGGSIPGSSNGPSTPGKSDGTGGPTADGAEFLTATYTTIDDARTSSKIEITVIPSSYVYKGAPTGQPVVWAASKSSSGPSSSDTFKAPTNNIVAFDELASDTTYYIYVKAAADDNYKEGPAFLAVPTSGDFPRTDPVGFPGAGLQAWNPQLTVSTTTITVTPGADTVKPSDQKIEYGISTVQGEGPKTWFVKGEPGDASVNITTAEGVLPGITYYVWARSAYLQNSVVGNKGYEPGEPKESVASIAVPKATAGTVAKVDLTDVEGVFKTAATDKAGKKFSITFTEPSITYSPTRPAGTTAQTILYTLTKGTTSTPVAPGVTDEWLPYAEFVAKAELESRKDQMDTGTYYYVYAKAEENTWYAEGSVVEPTSYVLIQAPGKEIDTFAPIKALIDASSPPTPTTITLTSAAAVDTNLGIVAKTASPASAQTDLEVTLHTAATVTALAAATDVVWKPVVVSADVVFTSLKPNTTYKLYARYAETTTNEAGPVKAATQGATTATDLDLATLKTAASTGAKNGAPVKWAVVADTSTLFTSRTPASVITAVDSVVMEDVDGAQTGQAKIEFVISAVSATAEPAQGWVSVVWNSSAAGGASTPKTAAATFTNWKFPDGSALKGATEYKLWARSAEEEVGTSTKVTYLPGTAVSITFKTDRLTSTGTITWNPTLGTVTGNRQDGYNFTVNGAPTVASNTGDQPLQYALYTDTAAPTEAQANGVFAWQDTATFKNVPAGTYNVFARLAQTQDYDATSGTRGGTLSIVVPVNPLSEKTAVTDPAALNYGTAGTAAVTFEAQSTNTAAAITYKWYYKATDFGTVGDVSDGAVISGQTATTLSVAVDATGNTTPNIGSYTSSGGSIFVRCVAEQTVSGDTFTVVSGSAEIKVNQ